MEDKRVLVIGGKGYIGKEVVSGLVLEGYEVTIMSRSVVENEGVKESESKGVSYLKGDVMDRGFLFSSLKNYDLVVYLAAVARCMNKSKYKENSIGLKNTIEAMKHNSIDKIVYFSTQNVHIPRTGYYGNSKKLCESILLTSGLDYVMLRPNYVYGLDKKNDFYKLVRLVKTFRLCPIIGDGLNKFQPIRKEDVAAATVASVKYFKKGVVADLSGDETLSLNDVADFLRKKIKKKFVVFHFPIFLLKPLKNIMPFDVQGYDSDRLAKDENPFSKNKFNVYDDLEKIIGL